ncbi:hypothetical protein AB1L88_19730 [Tautonia sp. JC769]|uniref:hypothetical protein n=1 Tax=Tautonia sp. JC769 TaxID=3232135 RepID=UPI00345AF9B1
MTEPLRQQIARLRELAPELNEVTDKATRLVGVVEKFLNEELSLGIPCRVTVSDSWDPSDELRHCKDLHYGRFEGKFRLYVAEYTIYHDGEGDNYKETPWSSCPRDLKLASFQKIPDLLADLTKKVEQAIKETEGTGKTIQELLKAIGGKEESE